LPKNKWQVSSNEGNEPVGRQATIFMNVVEIEVQNIEQYHKKGVIAHIMKGARPEVHEGVIFVGENSKWMRIDFFAGKDAKGNPLVRPFYVTQEIAESIAPASAEVLRTYGGRVTFVVQRVLPPPS
jgi:hypothetical protein